jgi:hypothetical protein
MTTAESRSTSLYIAGRTPLRVSVVVGWARALVGAGAVLIIGRIIDRATAGDAPTGLFIWLAALLLARAALSPRLASSPTCGPGS